MYIRRRIISFHARNFGYVGKRAAKLLVIKVGGLKNKTKDWALVQNAALIGVEVSLD